MDYEKLYNAYYMQVYSYAVTLTRDSALAEEITQNTFFKAATTDAGFRGRSSELTWLCAIAKNLYFDELRKHRHISDMTEAAELISDEDIEHSAADSDMAFRIHLIFHQLDEPYREVFQLRVFGELPFAQIAAIFGRTEGWARVTYHRARIKIREKLEGRHE